MRREDVETEYVEYVLSKRKLKIYDPDLILESSLRKRHLYRSASTDPAFL